LLIGSGQFRRTLRRASSQFVMTISQFFLGGLTFGDLSVKGQDRFSILKFNAGGFIDREIVR
jgi:hypothetical protein